VISGASGSGKTSLAFELAESLRISHSAYLIRVPCVELVSEKISDLCNFFDQVLSEAYAHAPGVVVFDDLDVLLPNPSEGDSHHNLRVSRLAETLSDLITSHKDRWIASIPDSQTNFVFGVCCIAVCKNRKVLPQCLRIPGCFDIEFMIPSLQPDFRILLFKEFLRRYSPQIIIDQFDFDLLRHKLDSFALADIDSVANKAAFMLLESCNPSIEDILVCLRGYVPATLKYIRLDKSAETQWNEIGGLEEICKVLKETLELPTKFSKLFERCPIKLRSGILLYGPPGSGKTLVASAVAKECGLNFISVKGPELLNKYIGASEEAVRNVFEQAKEASPCVVFFDEFDSIVPRRGGDSTGVTDRVVNQLLCELDGVESRGNVYVLAATSRPDLIDPALLRPGRLEKALYCGIPDFSARLSILQILSKQYPLSNDVNFEEIASLTDGYSGADLSGLCSTALTMAMHQPSSMGEIRVGMKHLLDSLKETRQSVSQAERRKYEAIYASFLGNRNGEFNLQTRQEQLKQRTALA
jgi:peroxin-1